MTTLLDLPQLNRWLVGFDKVFDLPDYNQSQSFPPHDIVKLNDDSYEITLALAGFNREDVEIVTHEGNLTIKSINTKQDESVEEAAKQGKAYIYKGIARRSFIKTFRLADYMEVTGARMENGLLTISLKRLIPESAKPKAIPIQIEQSTTANLKT